jgi:hypothetical protein
MRYVFHAVEGLTGIYIGGRSAIIILFRKKKVRQATVVPVLA